MDITQESVLVGTMLGDGGLRYKGKNCRLHIKHAAWQLPLVQFKHEIFKNFVSMKIRGFIQFVKGNKYSFIEFVSRTHPDFTIFYNIFYRDGKKIVPNNIEMLLTEPLSLAVWFMDDGSAEYAGVSFQTHCFSKKEVKLLQHCLELNFELLTTIRQNKGRWILYIPKRSLMKFRSLVHPFMLNRFLYKLIPYSVKNKTNPVETVRRCPDIKLG
ncbi:hypothetical protein HZB06_03325 [Candidatus Wolfebacteria bacterium]|nr:hypothetical protein [Candidatus Wolfebacteria bacterium]